MPGRAPWLGINSHLCAWHSAPSHSLLLAESMCRAPPPSHQRKGSQHCSRGRLLYQHAGKFRSGTWPRPLTRAQKTPTLERFQPEPSGREGVTSRGWIPAKHFLSPFLPPPTAVLGCDAAGREGAQRGHYTPATLCLYQSQPGGGDVTMETGQGAQCQLHNPAPGALQWEQNPKIWPHMDRRVHHNPGSGTCLGKWMPR